MGARLTDSTQYAHLWGSTEARALLDEPVRVQAWLDILAALAQAQAEVGLIPAAAADSIGRHARVETLDLDLVARETARSGHSMLGLIRGLREILPSDTFEYVYWGTTVQDVTDTWFSVLMRDIGTIVRRDLRALEELLLDLAVRHRETLMAGRTHAQIGSPITFGLTCASWADEIRRHIERLDEGRHRWLVVQLGGAVGSLGFFGSTGTALRAAFAARLGLGDPLISWTSSRDRLAEFGTVLTLVGGTLARIGTEVMELARPEIGELREAADPAAVSSITMPHKRNPETSEHLDTLARLARAQHAVLMESLVSIHQRDGRAWKAEWVALPELCLLSCAALDLTLGVLRGIEVDPSAMAANLRAHGADWAGEQLLAGLTGKLGKHSAQAVLHDLRTSSDGGDLAEELVHSGYATPEDVQTWMGRPELTAVHDMIDAVVARGRKARTAEQSSWT